MSAESAFIESLRALATHRAARRLLDDAAVLEVGGATLVLTHDMLVEGVHFRFDLLDHTPRPENGLKNLGSLDSLEEVFTAVTGRAIDEQSEGRIADVRAQRRVARRLS